MLSYFWRNNAEVEEKNNIIKENNNNNIINDDIIDDGESSDSENFEYISVPENTEDYIEKLKFQLETIHNQDLLAQAEQRFDKTNLITNNQPQVEQSLTITSTTTDNKQFYFDKLHATKLQKNEAMKAARDPQRVYLPEQNRWAKYGIYSISRMECESFDPSKIPYFQGEIPTMMNALLSIQPMANPEENSIEYYYQRKTKRRIRFEVETEFMDSDLFRAENSELYDSLSRNGTYFMYRDRIDKLSTKSNQHIAELFKELEGSKKRVQEAKKLMEVGLWESFIILGESMPRSQIQDENEDNDDDDFEYFSCSDDDDDDFGA